MTVQDIVSAILLYRTKRKGIKCPQKAVKIHAIYLGNKRKTELRQTVTLLSPTHRCATSPDCGCIFCTFCPLPFEPACCKRPVARRNSSGVQVSTSVSIVHARWDCSTISRASEHKYPIRDLLSQFFLPMQVLYYICTCMLYPKYL